MKTDPEGAGSVTAPECPRTSVPNCSSPSYRTEGARGGAHPTQLLSLPHRPRLPCCSPVESGWAGRQKQSPAGTPSQGTCQKPLRTCDYLCSCRTKTSFSEPHGRRENGRSSEACSLLTLSSLDCGSFNHLHYNTNIIFTIFPKVLLSITSYTQG